MKTRTKEYKQDYNTYRVNKKINTTSKKLKKLETDLNLTKAKMMLNKIIDHVNETQKLIIEMQEACIFNDAVQLV